MDVIIAAVITAVGTVTAAVITKRRGGSAEDASSDEAPGSVDERDAASAGQSLVERDR
jgi:hypothetical protein